MSFVVFLSTKLVIFPIRDLFSINKRIIWPGNSDPEVKWLACSLTEGEHADLSSNEQHQPASIYHRLVLSWSTCKEAWTVTERMLLMTWCSKHGAFILRNHVILSPQWKEHLCQTLPIAWRAYMHWVYFWTATEDSTHSGGSGGGMGVWDKLHSCSFVLWIEVIHGSREIPRQLKVLAALPEDLVRFPATTRRLLLAAMLSKQTIWT